MPIKSTTPTQGGKRKKKRKKIQKNLQNKSKDKNNKCFSWVTAVRVLCRPGNHSPPYLPRMPSNTVLIPGPAVGAAHILIWSYSCVFLPPVSTPSELVRFLLWECSITFYMFCRHSVPSWSCGFNLQLVQLVGRFWVFFLSHTVPGFQLWLYFHLCICVVHWGLFLRLHWRTCVCPCEGLVWKWCSCLHCRGSGSTRCSGIGG